MEQEGFLLTFSPPSSQTNQGENDKLSWCFGTFILKH